MTGTGRTPARDFRSWPFPEATPAAVWPPGRGDAWLILHGPPPALPLVLTGQRLASWVVFRLLSLICPSYQHPRAPTVGPPWALHWAVIVVKSRAELRGSDRQCGGFVMGDPHRHGGWKDGGASQASERRGVGEAHAGPGGRGLDRASKGRVGPRVRRRPLRSRARGGWRERLRWGLRTPRGVRPPLSRALGNHRSVYVLAAARKSGLQFRRFAEAAEQSMGGGAVRTSHPCPVSEDNGLEGRGRVR